MTNIDAWGKTGNTTMTHFSNSPKVWMVGKNSQIPRIYTVVGVQGNKWIGMLPIEIDLDMPEKHQLRYLLDDGILHNISLSFWYSITGRKVQTDWGYLPKFKEVQYLCKIRCKIYVPDEETPEPPFSGWLWLDGR